MKRLLLIAVLLLVGGVSLQGGMAMPDIGGWFQRDGVPSQAVIIYESGTTSPLSPSLVELYAKAPSLNVGVWDKGVLGKGRQPSAEAKPFLDAAAGHDLPVVVLRYASGRIAVKPVGTLDELRRAIGQ